MKANLTEQLKLKDKTFLPYKVSGTGDPIVFIHGLFGKSDDYKKVINEISKNYCCISFDLRGHGDSKAEVGFNLEQFTKDCKELIDFLNLKNFSMLGYSTGALVIFNYIKQFGCDNIYKLIFVDITPNIINESDWSLGLYRGEYTTKDLHKDLSIMERDFFKFYSYFTYRNMTKYNEKKPYNSQATLLSKILSRLLIGKKSKVQKMTKEIWKDISTYDFRSVLCKIKVSTAFFYANPGSLFSPKTAEFMKNEVKGSITVPFNNASHAMLFSHEK